MGNGKHLTCGSLFTGVGGLDLPASEFGFRHIWMVENDPHAQAVLRLHFPDVSLHDDVRSVGAKNLDTVDVITGGFPCQDVSLAGTQGGIDKIGGRSNLWYEFKRIITELRPSWVIVENVPNLLRINGGEDFATVLEGITGYRPNVPNGGWRSGGYADGGKSGTGYNLAWRVLDSQFFGVAQRRKRVFIVASLGRYGGCKILFKPQGFDGDSPKGSPEKRVRETSAGIAERAVARRIYWDGSEVVDTLNCSSLEKGQMLPEKQRFHVVGTLDESSPIWQMNHASEVYRPSGDISPTLVSRMGTGGNNVPLVGMRRLTPGECCSLQGFEKDWNEYGIYLDKDGLPVRRKISDSHRYHQMGNAVTVNVARDIWERIAYEETMGDNE